jgi:hypothetical protein
MCWSRAEHAITSPPRLRGALIGLSSPPTTIPTMLHGVRLGREMLIYTAAEMGHACGQSRDAHGHPTHRTANHARSSVAVPSRPQHLTSHVSSARRSIMSATRAIQSSQSRHTPIEHACGASVNISTSYHSSTGPPGPDSLSRTRYMSPC